MILNELFSLSELSPGTLASYKKKAGADASAADAAGDYARGNKRFKGIVKATKKEFAKNVDEAYDPAAAAKIIGVATKAGIRIFYDKFAYDSNFQNEIEAEYGFKYHDIKITAIPTAIGFAKSAMAWLNARGAYLTYDPKAPVEFQLTMPNQAEPYTFNVFDVMERWKPYNESAPGASNRTAKFDPKTGLPLSKQLSEFGGDATEFMPPTQSTPTTEQPPRRGYSIMLTGKPGRDWMAEYAWQALEAVFPREYPGNSSVSNYSGDKTVTPAMRKVLEVANRGSAVAKTGITSEDIAETLVAKLAVNRVPAQYWRITSEDLDEGVTEGINDRGFFNNVEQWHEAKSEIEHDDQWETPKYIVVKNNGKTVAKWSKADNYGWVDSSEQGVAEGLVKGEYGRVLDALQLYYPRLSMEELDVPGYHKVVADKANVPVEYAARVINDFVRDNDPDKDEFGDFNDDEQGVAEAADNELQSMLRSAGIVRNI